MLREYFEGDIGGGDIVCGDESDKMKISLDFFLNKPDRYLTI